MEKQCLACDHSESPPGPAECATKTSHHCGRQEGSSAFLRLKYIVLFCVSLTLAGRYRIPLIAPSAVVPQETVALLHKTNNSINTTWHEVNVTIAEAELAKPHNTRASNTTSKVPSSPLVLASNNSTNSTKNKPIMIFHVGPYKHATTFSQCAFSMNAFDLLALDNITYLGTCSCNFQTRVVDGPCEVHSGGAFFKKGNELTTEFSQYLEQSRGKHAMMLWEFFSDLPVARVKYFMELLQRDWQILWVANYRPLYDSLRSMHGQMYDPQVGGRDHLRIWPGQNNSKGVVGRPMVPFGMYTKRERNRLSVSNRFIDPVERYGLHPTELARDRYKPYLDQEAVDGMRIIDMDQLGRDGHPVLEYLVCEIIPMANHTCAAARRNKLDTGKNNNARFKMNYDLLAVAAHSQGLINSFPRSLTNLGNGTSVVKDYAYSRKEMWNKIELHQEKVLNLTSRDFPSICFDEGDLNRLYNLSWGAHKSLFGPNETLHRAGFDQRVEEQQFCHIDVDATLARTEWLSFFAELASAQQAKLASVASKST